MGTKCTSDVTPVHFNKFCFAFCLSCFYLSAGLRSVLPLNDSLDLFSEVACNILIHFPNQISFHLSSPWAKQAWHCPSCLLVYPFCVYLFSSWFMNKHVKYKVTGSCWFPNPGASDISRSIQLCDYVSLTESSQGNHLSQNSRLQLPVTLLNQSHRITETLF